MPPTPSSSRLPLVGLSLAALLPALGSSIANVALPSLAAALDEPFASVQWVVLAYLGAMTAAMVSAGRLGDRLGRRRTLAAGLAALVVASLACSIAPSLATLVAARAAQGAAAAVVLALAVAFVGDLVPAARTGRAMGLLGAMSAVGTALGPSLGGGLIEVFGWRSVFLVNVPLGLAALVLLQRLPRDLAAPASAPAPSLSPPPPSRSPLSALLADRASRASLVANLIVSAVLMATLVVGPFHLAHTFALDAGAIGALMSLGPIATAALGVPAGRLVDRLGAPRTTLAGLAGIMLGAALVAAAPTSLGVLGYVLPIVVVTSSYALFQAANNTAVMRDVAPERRGVVSGVLNLSRNLGLIAGTALMGAVFAAAGLAPTFALGAALAALALVLVRRAQMPSRPPRPARSRRSRPWLVQVGLVLLFVVPLAAGAARLVGLASGDVPPADARFAESPTPVVLHIVAATLYVLLGALQLSPAARRRWPRAHRMAGRVALVAGLVVALTGVWMTLFYAIPPELTGGPLFVTRLLVGSAMAAALVLAYTTIRRGDVAAHRAWSLRALALGAGAGTQVVLMGPWTAAFGIPTGAPYQLLMIVAWVLNLAIAERVIRGRGRALVGARRGNAYSPPPPPESIGVTTVGATTSSPSGPVTHTV